MTYQEAVQKGKQYLEENKIEDAGVDAWLLMEFVTGMSRTRFFVDGILEMKSEEEKQYFSLLEKRGQRIPLQHLTGVQEFMGMEFFVNEHVLVPRQDTELLVLETEKRMKHMSGAESEKLLLDMCTGSGCIVLSLKVRNKEWQCVAADISEEALKVANKNAEKLDAEVKFVLTDMFSNIEGKFDTIVSNPPYIPTKVIEELEEEVRLHDPFSALDGKEDGLFFYRILAKESPSYLKDGGWLCMEIGHDQSEDVEALLRAEGFEEISTQKDLAGLDRIVTGKYNRP